jgi:Na+-driven multidrug efflux pump
MGFNIIASSFFTAITDAKTSILISSLRTLILFIINLLILPIIIGYWGLWLVVPITETFTFFYSTYKYKKFKLKYEN